MKSVNIKTRTIEKTLRGMNASRFESIYSIDGVPFFRLFFQTSIQTAVCQNIRSPLRLDIHEQLPRKKFQDDFITDPDIVTLARSRERHLLGITRIEE